VLLVSERHACQCPVSSRLADVIETGFKVKLRYCKSHLRLRLVDGPLHLAHLPNVR
jgi:hypothetical protein